MRALPVAGVTKSYGDTPVPCGASLPVEPGSPTAFGWHELRGTGELSGSVAEVTVLIRPEQVVLTPVAARHAAAAEGAEGATAWPTTEGTC